MNDCKCCEALRNKLDQIEFEIRMNKINQMQSEIEQRLDRVDKKLDS
ncbi:hypothetical protein [Bacillus sp. SD088]|nr:hypothetical protein [Bacillus sp. SD088]MBO0995925.1 hypothetical protein [Bacillus sp. SD088]